MYKLTFILAIIILPLFIIGFIQQAEAKETGITLPDFSSNAKAVVLMDYDTGKVIYDIKGDQPLAPASITKLLTIYIVLEKIHSGEISWNTPITASLNVERVGEAQVYLKKGESYSLHEMVKAMLIPSANDAAVAIAENISGSETNFVKLMNAKAKALGLKKSHFINATGLPTHTSNDNYHYMSANDIATLAQRLIEDYPEILEFTSLKKSTFRNGKYAIENTNELLKSYPGMDGLKTGFTNRAKHCLCSTTKRNKLRLISVVLGAPTKYECKTTTINLLNYGFDNYATIKKLRIRKKALKILNAALIKNIKQHPPILVNVYNTKPWFIIYLKDSCQ